MVQMDIHKAIWHIRTRMQEHLRAVPESILTAPLARDVKWSSPSKGTIKINCDAAIGLDRAYVAIVARDWRRALVFALSKRVKTNIPVQAEAKAINWAVQQILSHNINGATVESDA